MFLGMTLAFQSSIVTFLSASENGLTPAGILLADWLVCESNAFTYSCAKQRIFVTIWWFFLPYCLEDPSSQPHRPQGYNLQFKGVAHTKAPAPNLCVYCRPTVSFEVKLENVLTLVESKLLGIVEPDTAKSGYTVSLTPLCKSNCNVRGSVVRGHLCVLL